MNINTWFNTYPRPQFKRNSFYNLNKNWILNNKSINIPFCPQSKLSKYEGNINENFVNINSASEEELTSLKHIGPAIALRIIEYRETHGGFMNIDEIKNVRGIGQAVFEDIENYICV